MRKILSRRASFIKSFCMFLALGFVPTAAVHAQQIFYSGVYNGAGTTLETNEASNWRNTAINKVWDGDGNDQYGTEGFLMVCVAGNWDMGINNNLWGYGGTSEKQNGNSSGYSVQNVKAPNNKISATISVGSLDSATESYAGLRAVSSYEHVRFGVMNDVIPASNTYWVNSSLKLSTSNSASGVAASSVLARDNVADIYFWDVLNVSPNNVYKIFGNAYAGIMFVDAVTWDGNYDSSHLFNLTDTSNANYVNLSAAGSTILKQSNDVYSSVVMTRTDADANGTADGLTISGLKKSSKFAIALDSTGNQVFFASDAAGHFANPLPDNCFTGVSNGSIATTTALDSNLTIDGKTYYFRSDNVFSGQVTMKNGAKLDIGSTSQKFSVKATGMATGRGTIVGDGTGTLEITGEQADCWYNFDLTDKGSLNISAGNFAFQGNSTWGTLTFSGGGGLWMYGNSEYNGTITTSKNANETYKTGTLYAGKVNGTGSMENPGVFNGPIEGGFSISMEHNDNTFIATFNAANSYTGKTTIGSYATLNLEKAGTLGAGATEVKSGGKLNIQNTTADLNLASAISVANGGSMTVSNTGAGVTINSATIAEGGTLNLEGTLNSAVKGTYNIKGTMNAKANNAISPEAVLKFDTNGVLNIGATTQKLELQATGRPAKGLVKGDGASLTLVNIRDADVWTSIDLGATGKLYVDSSCGNIGWQGNYTFETLDWQSNGNTLWIYADSTVTGNMKTGDANTNMTTLRLGCSNSTNGNPLTFNGSISGKFQVVMQNQNNDNQAKTVVFTEPNSYTGTTNISNGTLIVKDNGTLGSGAVLNNSELVFESTNGQEISNAISGTGSVTVQGDADTAIMFSGNNTYTGDTNIDAGIVTLTGNGSLGSGALTTASGSQITITDGWSGNLINASYNIGGMLTDLSSKKVSLEGKKVAVDLKFSADDRGILDYAADADIDGMELSLTNTNTGSTISLGDEFLIVKANEFDTYNINDLSFDTANNALLAYESGRWLYDIAPLTGGGYGLIATASDASHVPEPSTWVLLILGLAGVYQLRRNRKR